MPTYDYKCSSCKYVFEVFQSMSDDPLKICPECGKEVKRQVGGGLGIIFKGSGFYVTDNKKKSSASSASSPAPASEAAAATATAAATASSSEGIKKKTETKAS